MKRTFRAATVFTGAAACAAALTPAAQAAAVAPGARVVPDATAHACTVSLEAHGVVLDYAATNPHSPGCVSGSGTVPIGGHPRFAAYCADGASGSMLVDGTWHPFTVGYHNLYNQVVSSVYIHAGAAGHFCGA